MATKSFVVLLWGVLLLGWRGTEGQLMPESVTTPSTNDIPADIFMALLKDMVNNNEDLDFLKPLLSPSTQTQSPTQGSQQGQEVDDDYVTQGPTFAMTPQRDDDDDIQCTCPNSNGGQEPDDDNMQGGSQSGQEPDDDNMQSGSQGSSPASLLSTLLKLMNMNN